MKRRSGCRLFSHGSFYLCSANQLPSFAYVTTLSERDTDKEELTLFLFRKIASLRDTECQEWIIKALKDHTVLSRKQIDEFLWSKLPIDYTD